MTSYIANRNLVLDANAYLSYNSDIRQNLSECLLARQSIKLIASESPQTRQREKGGLNRPAGIPLQVSTSAGHVERYGKHSCCWRAVGR